MPSSMHMPDELAGTLEAIMLEQAQLPWQSRTARWQYRQDHVADLLSREPEPEPEPEPGAEQEPELVSPEDEEQEQGQEQEQEQEQNKPRHPVRTLGDAQVAMTRAAEATHQIQTAHMGFYGASWRDQRLFTVPGREGASLLQREAPLPSFSIWKAEQAQTLVADALSAKVGPTIERMRQQEELLLSRVDALEGAAELGQWCGEDVNESLVVARSLRAALQVVQKRIEPHVRELASESRCEPQVLSHVSPAPEATPHPPSVVMNPPDWSQAEQTLDRAAKQLQATRTARLAKVQMETANTMDALSRQGECLRSETARVQATEQSMRLRRRHEHLQCARERWHQRNEFLPADELLRGVN